MKLARNSRRCSTVDGDGKKERAPPFRNPFVHDIRFTPLQKAQIAVMTVTLFPIRLFFAAFMMLLAWPFAFLASMGRSEKVIEEPLSWWRKVFDVLLKVIMRAMWFAGGFHWMTVKGRQALPTEAPILTLAPHSSYFDAIPVTMTMASIVMKAESKDIPVWGRAFIPAVPVQPVVLRYPNKMDTITWTWQGPGAFDILWLTLCQLHNVVEIEFLPVYTPSDEEKKNPALFANNVRCLMAKALEVPVTDYSFEDCQLAMAEGQLKLPAETCLLEFAKLVRRLSLKPEKVEKDLEEYGERARKTKGKRLDLEGFASYLNLTVSDTLKDMFALFDENEDGTMDAREYVIALSVVCKPSKTLETIKLAFKMYESEQDQTILEEHLACILKTALGVSELNVTDLFRAIDILEKGKITFNDFNDFAEQSPDFAEEYLYPEQTGFLSSAETPSALIANGFCTDFSPEDQYEEERRPQRKKLN
ncbi:Lysophosphatidylcholine acyltransferase 1 [Acipenser ruthenus]|uniref:Lysophosphatidylcholine acyltransferase 1 n=1 Tax=Acipenser ruthenus TaxID=7906 RepID=A0A444TXG9_ACIRT|nr:Lysophosphatidylcholine acyltransferase 1 [Acipenser ruthenus]